MSDKAVTRRAVLGGGAAAGALLAAPLPAWGGAIGAALGRGRARRLAFLNLHTGERLVETYWAEGRYDARALARIDRLLRDHRTGEVLTIDRALLDQLVALNRRLGRGGAFQVISGYRSAETNAMLAARSGAVATHSLHIEGRAIDIRVPGVAPRDVARAALSLEAGGVGLYSRANFVHVDTGRVRRWGG